MSKQPRKAQVTIPEPIATMFSLQASRYVEAVHAAEVEL